MLSKLEFSTLIKTNFLWPGYDWYLRNTVNGLEGASNEYISGVVEIIIDYLYQRYVYVQQFTNIFDINRADSDKEIVGLKDSKKTVKPGDTIRVYNTQNYNNEYIVLEPPEDTLDASSFVYIGESYVSEVITNSSYYTLVSLNKYTESNPIHFDPDTPVIKVSCSEDPKFLPLIGYKVGQKYDTSVSIAENKKLIKSAIDIYKIKGSILSIKRVMNLLGYDSDVVEPYKLVMQYGKSKYNFKDHYQDWKYYHNGIFEIVTENVSLNNYKNAISTLVQPAGTRLVARANLNLGVVPILGDVLLNYSDSYFIQLLVRAFKSGNIFDEISHHRTRSGDVELFGLYTDVGTEIGPTVGFRRVWDSQIFSLSDLMTPNIIVNLAAKYSSNLGAFSGDTSTILGWESPYDETSPLDVQLDMILTSKNERPAMRSEFAQRSGAFSMSGLDGNSWTWKPYYIVNYNAPIQSSTTDPRSPIDIGVDFEGLAPYSAFSGDRLDVNRKLSGVRTIYGVEFSLGFRTPTPEDWGERIYWSWDDTAVIVDAKTDSQPAYNLVEILTDSSASIRKSQENRFNQDNFFSGIRNIYDIDITLGYPVPTEDYWKHEILNNYMVLIDSSTEIDPLFMSPAIENDTPEFRYTRREIRRSEDGCFSGARSVYEIDVTPSN